MVMEPHSEFYGMFGVSYFVGHKTPPDTANDVT